jgi:hypothetical protein
MNFAIRSSLLLFVWLFSVTSTQAATLEGKATVSADSIAGIEVFAYPVDTLGFDSPAPYRFGPTQADGHFAFDLPKGRYYLLAKGPGLFTYYGRNPVSVPKEGLKNINLLMLSTQLLGPADKPRIDSGIVGTVSLDGQPLKNAIVTIYPDLSSQLKGMGLGMAAPTDDEGFFEVPLPAGTYYLVVRVRKSGLMAGPLKAGDFFGYLSNNPLSLKKGAVARVHVPVIEVPEKVDRHAATLFGNTRIAGRILGSSGKPVAGVRAMLYDDSMMLNRPLFVSQPSDADGVFALSFPKGGTYFLSARDQLGGTPAPGELYGRYQGSADHSIRIRTGKLLEGVEIVVEEVY